MTWKELGVSLCSKFDRDEHNHLLRRFFHLKQTNTVTEYIESFTNVVHPLLVHTPQMDSSLITNRFIDGLREDIKAVVLVQCPHDIDTAVSVALLQEEVTARSSKREFRRSDNSYSKKVSMDSGRISLPPSPPYTKSTTSNRVDTRPPEDISPTEAMVKLKAYRRSKGLCFKCGEKWNPGHKCPKNMSLNAVEEIWKLFEMTTLISLGTVQLLTLIHVD